MSATPSGRIAVCRTKTNLPYVFVSCLSIYIFSVCVCERSLFYQVIIGSAFVSLYRFLIEAACIMMSWEATGKASTSFFDFVVAAYSLPIFWIARPTGLSLVISTVDKTVDQFVGVPDRFTIRATVTREALHGLAQCSDKAPKNHNPLRI